MLPRRSPARFRSLALAAACGFACLALPLAAAVQGTVRNATTGQPAAGVALTLSSFRDGMTPVEETVSANDGSFAFEKELPGVAAQQPFLGAIRAEKDGVGYTEILRAGESLDSISVTVYSAVETDLPPPSGRVIIFETEEAEMVVRDSFQFLNESDPPVTYSAESGTLRFHLPPEAGGEVEVSGTGPAGMPLRSTALPTDQPDLYKVDFPLKPGASSITLAYVVPRTDPTPFLARSAYRGVQTRVAAPAGVSIEGAGLVSLGQEPETRASIYALPDAAEVALAVTGVGRLPNRRAATPSAAAQITVEPAMIAKETLWIIGLSVLILGLGFYHLLTSTRSGGKENQATRQPKGPRSAQ